MGFVQTLSALVRRAPPPPVSVSGSAPGLDAVLKRLDALAAEDRRLEALAHGEDHAGRLDEAALWSRIGRLRMEAVPEAVARSTPRAQWPLDLPDPFPEETGLPEIAASELSWPTLGGAILHHGSLIVRGLVDPATAARLRAGIDEALDAYDAFLKDAPGGGAYLPVEVPSTEPLANTRPWTRESGGVWAADVPRLFQTVLGVFEAQGVIDAVGGYLGERPVLSVGKTVFRRAEPDGHGIFHQDGAFMGADIRTVNVWTALSPCGEDAPGLEIVPRRIPFVVETGTGDAIFPWAAGRTAAERVAGDRPIAFPVFGTGDAVIFDQLMLHATGVRPGMTQRRYALESWFFAPSSYAADQVPIVI